jgi:hypothetical protein
MRRRARGLVLGVAAVWFIALGAAAIAAIAEDALRPAVSRGVLLRSLVALQQVPAVAMEARAMTMAEAALDQTGNHLWDVLLAQGGDADHAFRWTSANRALIEDAKARFRKARAAYVSSAEALAEAAAASAKLKARAASCALEQARCLARWDAFACVPLLPVCLAADL